MNVVALGKNAKGLIAGVTCPLLFGSGEALRYDSDPHWALAAIVDAGTAGWMRVFTAENIWKALAQ